MKYQSKRIYIEAVKWEKPGDHPAVKRVFGYWRDDAEDTMPVFTPSHVADEGMGTDHRRMRLGANGKMDLIDPEQLMDCVTAIKIGETWRMVAPGDYVVTIATGQTDVVKAHEFEAAFEPAE